MANKIVVRSGLDRLRYTLVFEIVLLSMLSVGLAVFLERELTETGGLALILSTKAMILNFVFNYFYDQIDVKAGRIPTERSVAGRILHAVSFEAVLIITSLPIVMWWLNFSFWQAFLMDMVLIGLVLIYTFVFTLIYDRVFPVSQAVVEDTEYDLGLKA